MRWLKKRRVPKPIGITIVIGIILGILKTGGFLIKLTSNEILAANGVIFEKAESKIIDLIVTIEVFFGIERLQGENVILHYFQENNLMENFGNTLGFITDTLSMTLMTAFFVVLWLAESLNFYKVLSSTIFKHQYASAKIFMKIENDLITFVKVKFLVSALTGLGFGLACYFFNVSFPIFWGVFAFLINFVQMIGSIVSVILLALFAFVELDPTSTLLFFIISITLIQVIFGSILEPIFMGKSFSINVIAILVSLMFWGYIWGVPGLIMSIPITVFLKIVFEQFPQTKFFATLLKGTEQKIKISRRKKSF